MFRPAAPGQRCSLGYQLIVDVERDLGISLTLEQKRRLVDLYELDPVTGRRVVRRAGLRRPKGAGKSPEGGYVGYAELVLPVRFSHWSKAGQPVGAPVTPANGPATGPWVQFAAVSEDQTDNVMVWLFETLSEHADTRRRRGIDLGRSRLYLVDRPGRIEPVTAAAGSREGQPITMGVLDQTESWTRENGGRKLAATLRRNAGKTGGWTYELQNAPESGDGSVADETGRAAEKDSAGILFDTREPPEVADLTDRSALLDALRFAYGEAQAWVDLERLADEINDPDTDPSDARRYYLNTSAPSSERAFDRPKWAATADGTIADEGELIVVGFDGARFDDATALVAVDVVTGNAWAAGVWERDQRDAEWEVPEGEVTDVMAELFGRYQVWRAYCDPPYWETTVASWAGKWGRDRVVEWWTNRPTAVGHACKNLATSIRAGEIHHHVPEGDDALTRHVHNAVRRRANAYDDQRRPLWTLAKESPGSPRKIDAAMALVVAWEARGDAIAAGARKKGSGTSYFL